MSQQDVYDLLKKYRNKWFDSREIAKRLNASFNTVVSNLMRLRKAGMIAYKTAVKIIKPAGKKIVYMYKYKE
jgi:predicted transcriptional regulator